MFRAPQDATPFDHTSILKTVERRWNLPPLTRRDAAAPDLGVVLSLDRLRTDDPLTGVTVPVAAARNPAEDRPSHLQEVHAELVAALPVPDGRGGIHHSMPALRTSADYDAYIRTRTATWKASRKS